MHGCPTCSRFLHTDMLAARRVASLVNFASRDRTRVRGLSSAITSAGRFIILDKAWEEEEPRCCASHRRQGHSLRQSTARRHVKVRTWAATVQTITVTVVFKLTQYAVYIHRYLLASETREGSCRGSSSVAASDAHRCSPARLLHAVSRPGNGQQSSPEADQLSSSH